MYGFDPVAGALHQQAVGVRGPHGDVLRKLFQENATRFHDLAAVDVLEQGGRPLINIFRARPWPQPLRVRMLERHPLSSQAFVPVGQHPFLVIVAPPDEAPDPKGVRAFVTNGQQGVNYRRGVWHHPLLALEQVCDFLVVDRGADDRNCDEFHFPESADPIANLDLQRALKELPEVQRRLIVDVYVLRKTYEEAAEDNGIPLGTTKRYLRVALTTLRHGMGVGPVEGSG